MKNQDASTSPRRRDGRISAFFPCYNDEHTIAGVVRAADETLAAVTDDYEIIVVDDGSRDGSAEVLEELSKSVPALRVVTHSRNRGYGGAMQSGFAAATGELVFYTDGDGQYDPSHRMMNKGEGHEGQRQGAKIEGGLPAIPGAPELIARAEYRRK